MSMCPICNDTGWQKVKVNEYSSFMNPCPLCSLGENPVLDVEPLSKTDIEEVIDRCERKPRTKTTVIPDQLFEDDGDIEITNGEIDDDLTNTVADDLPALMEEVERKLSG